MTLPLQPTGFFVPINYTVPGAPIGMLADPIDPKTGEYLSIERGFDPTDAAVLSALRTVRRSGSAVMLKGQRFKDITHVDDAAAGRIRSEVEVALARLIETRQIELERVDVLAEPGVDYAEAAVYFVNLVTRQKRGALLAINPVRAA